MPNQFLDYAGLQLYTEQLKKYFDTNYSGITIQEITYAELVAARDNKELLPCQLYRLTNYVTTTNGRAAGNGASRSANHRFDLILQATDVNKLHSVVFAIPHAGDTYFANKHLENWIVNYSLDNNIDLYPWADEQNGKGVIYKLQDEKHNSACYDFKNIQFKRGSNWYYTYDSEGLDASLTVDVYNNEILGCTGYDLNNNVFKGLKFYNNRMGYDCYNNTFEDNCTHNIFNNKIYNNTFGTGFYYNTIGNSFVNNQLGNEIRNNVFNNWIANCVIGDYCAYNTFENNTRYIKTASGTAENRFTNNSIKALVGVSSNNLLVLDHEKLFGKISKGSMTMVNMDTEGHVLVYEICPTGIDGAYKENVFDTEWLPIKIEGSSSSEVCDCASIPNNLIEKLFEGEE